MQCVLAVLEMYCHIKKWRMCALLLKVQNGNYLEVVRQSSESVSSVSLTIQLMKISSTEKYNKTASADMPCE